MALVVKLGFNPFQCGCADTAAVFRDEVARTLYLLWRREHITSDTFPQQVLGVASRIKTVRPKTAVELAECFRCIWCDPLSNFHKEDIERFCPDALPYFTGEKKVEYEINLEPSAP